MGLRMRAQTSFVPCHIVVIGQECHQPLAGYLREESRPRFGVIWPKTACRLIGRCTSNSTFTGRSAPRQPSSTSGPAYADRATGGSLDPWDSHIPSQGPCFLDATDFLGALPKPRERIRLQQAKTSIGSKRRSFRSDRGAQARPVQPRSTM